MSESSITKHYLPLQIVLPQNVQVYGKQPDGRLKKYDIWLVKGESITITEVELFAPEADNHLAGKFVFEGQPCWVMLIDLKVRSEKTAASEEKRAMH